MRYDYDGKNVIVTGATGGIGKEVAKGIIAGGGSVALIGLTLDEANKVAAELGEHAHPYAMDQSNRDAVDAAFQQILDDFGRIDVLINVAGIISAKSFDELSPAEWDRTLAVNLTGPFNTVHAIWEHFKNNGGGRIVNVSSVAGKIGGGLAYASSKAGLNGFTKAIAKEGAKYGIYANAVCPSFTHTGMTAALEADPQKRQRVLSMIPLGRGAAPAEIAQMILFFGCDAASFITGEIGDCDGGIVMDG